ncbi:serine hydrolase family protein [archaeon]|jgi:uncharacterized protein|nr:serine hydrolase family protein [archaeon]MBT4350920.1 serine hydrolase family protein [archaeon]MBT4646948.1 serine hydrolase family protein [archaeon]MBT6821686.1 serine hydrolase family protein [archaeon]MBT7392217.1 serine hydrolase family protein [archaeon]
MTNIIIIHGAYGNPNENWFPWLKKELEKLGHNVYTPKFPTPKNQNLNNWLDVFIEFEKYIYEDTILIGHSLGSSFIINYLEQTNKKIKASFLVSSAIELLGNPKFDSINKTFVDKKFNWEKIKSNCNKFYVIHGDNDPHIPITHAYKLHENLNSNYLIIETGGHLNEKAGFITFGILKEYIIKEINQ